MLNENIKEILTERLAKRIEELNTKVLTKIIKGIDEMGTLSPTNAQRVANILRYGGDYQKLIKEIQKVTNLNAKEVEQILDEVAKKNYLNSKDYYTIKNMSYLPYEQNAVLQQQVDMLKKITSDTLQNYSNTKAIGFTIKDVDGNIKFKDISTAYNDAIDEALLSVSQGKETFETTVKRLINELGESGLKYIDYKSGRSIRLDSATRMNVQGAIRDIENQVQLTIAKQTNCDGIEVSVHEYPAPDHQDIQGHQFRLTEYDKMNNDLTFEDVNGKKYPITPRHIGMWNCYHNIFAINVGISKPLYTQEELDEIIKNNNKKTEIDGKQYNQYECTQLQRKLETEIRKQKDIQVMAIETDKRDIAEKAQKKINILTDKYKELSKKANLPTQTQRMQISGYRRIKVDRKPMLEGIDKSKVRQLPTSKTPGSELFNQEELFNMYVGDLNDKNVDVQSSIMNVDEKIRNRQLEQLNNLTDKYPLDRYKKSPLLVKCETLNNKGFVAQAWYKDKSISLNTKYYKDANYLLETEEGMINRKWSYSVPKDSYDIYTITHEYGHNIEYEYLRWMKETADRNNRRFNFKQCDKDLRDTLIHRTLRKTGEKLNMTQFKDKYFSGYGKSKANYEWFAELFTQSQLGEKTPFTDVFLEWLEEDFYK